MKVSMARQQLPSQIKKLVLEDKSIRYQVTIDAGPDPATGARRQTRRRYKTEKEARAALGAAIDAVERGTFVVRSRTTVAQAMDGYLSGRRRLRVSTLRGYRDSIQPLVDRHGEMDLQKLTKKHLDLLVTDLMAGGLPRSDGKPRKPWSPRSINYMLTIIRMALESELKQGHVARNVANLVDRPEPTKKEMQTFSPDEVRILLKSVHGERNGHAWHLALIGLRRGEIGGLRWTDIDFDARTLTVGNNRVTVGGVVYENRPKTARSERTLPLTDDLLHVLRVARRWQESEKSAIPAEYGPGTHVVCDQTGRPYHPETISTYWERALQRAGLKMIRLHDARHTAGTLLHLQGVPIAVISAWLGHASASFTMATYLHSQDDALTAAGARLGALVSLAEAPNADQR